MHDNPKFTKLTFNKYSFQGSALIVSSKFHVSIIITDFYYYKFY